MIIVAPTGLYKSILPTDSSPGNVTYTISSQSPPRPVINITQLPVFELLKSSPDKVHSQLAQRNNAGNLIFTVASGSRSVPGSNTKFFEVGEILTFDDLIPVGEINTVNTPSDVEIRHDTNLLDLEAVGLTPEEAKVLTLLSNKKQTELDKEFSQKRTEIENVDTNIRENQKSINETSKTLRAVEELLNVPLGGTSDNEIYVKLANNLNTLKLEREKLIISHNERTVELNNIYNSIIKIAELVR